MKLKEVVSELVVEDVKRSIDFYKEMLGFEVTAQVPETGSPGWAELVNGSARLMIQSREEPLNCQYWRNYAACLPV